MTQSSNPFSLFKRKPTEDDLETADLLAAMKENRESLRQARIYFNNVREPELIEASVYEINSIQARYAYLLRRLREQEEKQISHSAMNKAHGSAKV